MHLRFSVRIAMAYANAKERALVDREYVEAQRCQRIRDAILDFNRRTPEDNPKETE